jgi:hypothetical protein
MHKLKKSDFKVKLLKGKKIGRNYGVFYKGKMVAHGWAFRIGATNWVKNVIKRGSIEVDFNA